MEYVPQEEEVYSRATEIGLPDVTTYPKNIVSIVVEVPNGTGKTSTYQANFKKVNVSGKLKWDTAGTKKLK